MATEAPKKEWKAETIVLKDGSEELERTLNDMEEDDWLLCSLLPFDVRYHHPFVTCVWYRIPKQKPK